MTATSKSTGWWRGQTFTAVLLLIIIVLAVWALAVRGRQVHHELLRDCDLVNATS